MVSGRHVDQLRVDAEPAAGLAHAAFEHGPHAQLLADVADVGVLALEREARGPRGHVQGRDVGQHADDLLGDPVAEVLGVRIRAHVAKGQHRDRCLRGGRDEPAARAARPRRRVLPLGAVAGSIQHAQGERQVPGGLESRAGVLLQAVDQDLLELRRHGPAGVREGRRLLAKQRDHRLGGGSPSEGISTRDHLVEDDSGREDVGLRPGRLAPQLLRGHVADGAEHDAGGRARRRHPGERRIRLRHAHALGQAEVENLEVAVVAHDDVLGLQVPVHDPLVVRRGQALGDLQRERSRLAAPGGRPRLIRSRNVSPSNSSMTA